MMDKFRNAKYEKVSPNEEEEEEEDDDDDDYDDNEDVENNNDDFDEMDTLKNVEIKNKFKGKLAGKSWKYSKNLDGLIRTRVIIFAISRLPMVWPVHLGWWIADLGCRITIHD